MRPCLYPNPLYERVRDHLEQSIAILPQDPVSEAARTMLEEALDVVLWLAYLPPQGRPALHVVASNEVHDAKSRPC